jgi:hypothetical protein
LGAEINKAVCTNHSPSQGLSPINQPYLEPAEAPGGLNYAMVQRSFPYILLLIWLYITPTALDLLVSYASTKQSLASMSHTTDPTKVPSTKDAAYSAVEVEVDRASDQLEPHTKEEAEFPEWPSSPQKLKRNTFGICIDFVLLLFPLAFIG